MVYVFYLIIPNYRSIIYIQFPELLQKLYHASLEGYCQVGRALFGHCLHLSMRQPFVRRRCRDPSKSYLLGKGLNSLVQTARQTRCCDGDQGLGDRAIGLEPLHHVHVFGHHAWSRAPIERLHERRNAELHNDGAEVHADASTTARAKGQEFESGALTGGCGDVSVGGQESVRVVPLGILPRRRVVTDGKNVDDHIGVRRDVVTPHTRRLRVGVW